MLWDFGCVYLLKWVVSRDNAKAGCNLCALQMLMTFFFCLFCFLTTYFGIQVVRSGDTALVFMTFGAVWLLDQIKQLIMLSLVYFVVVRRFGFLSENQKEFVEASSLVEKHENAIPQTKLFCLKTLESESIERLSLFTIGLYSVFILFDLTATDIFTVNPRIMMMTDFVFLTIFLIEIVLKTFASSGGFLLDFFNSFDAIVVVLSWVLNIYNVQSKGLGVLRLIRVVVITIRNITGQKSRLRHASKYANPVESVLQILDQF